MLDREETTKKISRPDEITALDALYRALMLPWDGQYVSCHLIVGPMLSAPGSLYIEPGQLRFQRSKGLSGRLAPAEDIVVPLGEIAHVEFSQADVGIFMKTQKVIRLRGKLLVPIFAWLYARGVPSAPGRQDWTLQTVHGLLSITLSTGMLQRHGVLAVGDRQLIFMPLSSVDLSLGSWPMTLSVETVQQAKYDSDGIILSTTEGVTNFLIANPQHFTTPMVSVLHPLSLIHI